MPYPVRHPARRLVARSGGGSRWRRGALGALLSLVLVGSVALAPSASAAPAGADGTNRGPVVQKSTSKAVTPLHDGDHDEEPAEEIDPYKVLLFTQTTGFRHTDGINAGTAAIQALGAAHHFTVDATEDSTKFTTANLSQYKTVIFLSTTSPNVAAMFTAPQQAALKSYVESGGGYFGIHAASDANYDWDWYGQLVGAYFKQHPAIQPTKLLIEDKVHPSMAGLGDTIDLTDELYDFRANPRANVHVLASLDQSSYTGSTMGNDHPIAWCQDFDGGRSAYNALGHDATNWTKPWFTQMILGGIETTAGVADADCGASLAKNYEVVSLDDNTADPMMLDVASDGRVFYIEQYGLVKVINPTTHQTTQVANLPVTHDNESGLLGMALDPDFDANGYMYLYHSPNSPGSPNVDRLSRFTVDPTTNTFVAGSEKVVLDVPVQRQECCHHGGSMVFDQSTGNLYLATGDNSNPFASDGYAPVDYRTGRDYWDSSRTSGNTNSLSGKVLRIHPESDGTYTVPAGNLFASGTDKTRPEIYGMGFRNPFRINIDPTTHHLLVADYGPDAGSASDTRGPANTVEWNIVDTPGNYGWPFCTGNNAAYNRYNFDTKVSGTKYECATGPINDSPHNTGLTQLPAAIPADVYYHYNAGTDWPEIGGGGAPMAGAVYSYDPANTSGTKWPAYWSGKPLLAEWNKNTLFSVVTDAALTKPFKVVQTTLHTLPAPATRTIKMMDSKFGPDGSLYMIDWGSGWSENTDSGIYRIDYTAGDRAPIAKASADKTDGGSPLTVAFSAEGSNDPDGDTITYAWTFGDGEASTEKNPTHTFAKGVYNVQLSVTDEGGRTGVSNLQITAGNHRPVVTISSPMDGQFFEFGDQVSYTAAVTDAEDGSTADSTISCDAVMEQSSLGHFSGGSSHAHPMGSTSGCTATVQTLESGGHGGDVWLYWVIEVSYTDKGNDGVPALTGSSTVILQTKHRQAEHFNNTGRIPGTTSTGDPGVVVETTSDTAGGTSNIGYVEPGDWISFDRVNLKDITALSMRMAGTVGADFEVRWNDPVTGALLGTVPAKPTSGWQVFDDSQTNLAGVTDETGTLYLVAKKDGQNGSVVNVNWIDFIGKGATVNQRPDITSASVTPTTGTAPVTVQLAAAATDPEGENVTYQWDMGTTAGEKVSGATGSFTYVTPGTYTVTLTATDAKGAYGTRTFEVKVQPAPPTCLGAKSDDFDGTALDSARWSVIRPDGNLTVAGGKLVIPTAPADIYSSTNNAPNIVLQPMPVGAWEITTKVTGAMYTAYQQAGLVVYGDDDNYAKLVFSGRSSSGDKAARIIQFSHEQGGGAAQEANTAGLGTDFPDTVWLRLASDGTNLTPSYSTDGITWKSADDSWTGWSTVRKSTAAFTNPRVGLLSLANSGVAVDASFEYFYLTPDDSGTGSGPSDEFDGAKLADCIWTVIRPDGKITVADGSLTLPAAATDLYQTTNTAGNLVLQNLPDGAWEVTTKVTGAVSQAYAQGGILVYGDDDNYLKLVFEGRSTSADKAARIIQFSHEKNATAAEANSPNLGAGFPDTVWLRLTSDGSTVTPSYSADGTTWIAASNSWTGWSAIDKTTTGLNKIGLVAMGTSGTTTPANVSFDFFHLTGEEPTEDTTTPVTTATVSTADPAVVTLTAADEAGGSGIAKTEYRIGTQTWSTYTAPVSVARTDVDQTIEFRSTDKAGNVEDTKSATITKSADTTAPVTTATLNPASPSGENGWWNEQVTLTLSATDAKSGVASTQFALGDGEWQNYTAPVVIDVEGAQSITFRSTDVAGNVEATKSVEVKVDTIAPLVAANVEGNDPVTITVVASDETSGIAGREYKIGAGDWQSYSVPFTVARTATVQTVQFRATDKAGNTAATGSVVVPAAPVVQKPSVTGLSVSPASLPYGGTVTASITVTSAGSVGREVVALYDGNELIGAGVLKAGKVAITAEDLSIGSHPLKAVFAGSATVAGSESVVKTVNVAKATSAVGLKASAVTQAYGTAGPVKLTATVTLSSGLPAAGQVRFKDGSAVLATVPVISGKAGVKLSQTAKVGKHPITAQFLPADPTTTVGSTSQTVTITVTKATSIIKLKAGATTVGKGKAIAFATTVSLNTKQSPAGSVKFVVDGKTAKTVKVSGSSATYTLPGTTKAGKHTIKAVFVPTSASTVTGSSSSTVTVTITA